MKKYIIIILLANFIMMSCAHHNPKKSEALVNKILFPSSKEALVYILERRLQIQRLYENTSEPYFGRPEEKKCGENVDLEGKLQKERWGSFIYLKILVNDQLAIGDCLLEHNTKKALYEFYLCNNVVLEIRNYVDINAILPKTPTSKCTF